MNSDFLWFSCYLASRCQDINFSRHFWKRRYYHISLITRVTNFLVAPVLRSFQLVELRRPSSSSSVEFAETGFFPTPTIVSKNSVKCKCIQKPSNTKKVKKGLIQQLVKQAACQGTNNHFVPLFRQQGERPNEFEFQGGSKQKRFIWITILY